MIRLFFVEEALQISGNKLFFGFRGRGKKYATILGYNYNSSEWFSQSYKIFNKKTTNCQKQKKSK